MTQPETIALAARIVDARFQHGNDVTISVSALECDLLSGLLRSAATRPDGTLDDAKQVWAGSKHSLPSPSPQPALPTDVAGIIKRLRDLPHPAVGSICNEAADLIERLSVVQPAAEAMRERAIERVQLVYDEMCVMFSGGHSDDATDSMMLRLFAALKDLRAVPGGVSVPDGEVATLRAERDKLREALEPFAREAHHYDDGPDIAGVIDAAPVTGAIVVGDLRKVRALFTEVKS